MKCSRNPQHLYGSHLSSCPWCERRERLGGIDPFPAKGAQVQSLAPNPTAAPAPKPPATRAPTTSYPTRPTASQPPAISLNPLPGPAAPSQSPYRSPTRGTSLSPVRKSIWTSDVDPNMLALIAGLGLVVAWSVWRPSQNPSRQTSSTTWKPALPAPSPAILVMPRAALAWVPTKVQGIWRGTFSGDPAVLHVRWRNHNVFGGTLTTQGAKGTYQVAVQGVLSSTRDIAFRETKVLRLPRRGQWRFGINVGILSANNETISGRGKDPKSSFYPWTFSRPN